MAGETADADDFFACLRQDHARIEARLRALEQAAHTLSKRESDAAALGVVAETLGYFATEGALHEANEELTLFPRLRQRPEFDQIRAALEFQHRMNDAACKDLAACVECFAAGGGRELLRRALRFVELHRAHAVAEERALFPLAVSMLAPDVVAEMGCEMRERSGVSA